MSQVHYIADSSCLKTLVFMAAVSLTLMAPSALAGEPLRLTVDGHIFGLSVPIIPGSPLGNGAFGLVNGDPIRFVFDFDSRFDENGSIAIERYEVQIDGQSLVAAGPLLNTGIDASFTALTSSFTIESLDLATGEVNGIEAGVTVLTALPLFLAVTVPTSVLAGPPDGFPADLEFSDVISTFAGTFFLFDTGENFSSIFTFEVTDLGVAVVPEPGMAVISVLAFAACLRRRRRPWT